MRVKRWIIVVAVLAGAVGRPARGEFVEGNIYVTVITGEPSCFGAGDLSAIVEINPETGELSIFADSNGSDMCIPNGLRFTPDGERLLQLEYWESKVLSFHPDGSSEVLLDASDGLVGPAGVNGLAFDAGGDLYVVDADLSTIFRFPSAGGPGSVFVDWNDGVFSDGGVDFAPSGDLFYASDAAEGVYRFSPEGNGFFFDDPPGNHSALAMSADGTLFVGSGNAVYRYENSDPGTRTLLASGFIGVSGVPLPVALSPDGQTVYIAEIVGQVYAIDADANNGIPTVLADISDLPELFQVTPTGIAVYKPTVVGDFDGDGTVDLDDFAIFDECVTGPGGAISVPQCQGPDMDNDGDVDRADFRMFQVVFAGS